MALSFLNDSIEVNATLGGAIKDEMSEAHYLARKEHRQLAGWAMSPHGFLSLYTWFQCNAQTQRIEDLESFKFEGKPIFIHESLTPFLPLFSPKEATRLEYHARKLKKD